MNQDLIQMKFRVIQNEDQNKVKKIHTLGKDENISR